MSRLILLKIEHQEPNKIILTNEHGDTYTSTSEELADFLYDVSEIETEGFISK